VAAAGGDHKGDTSAGGLRHWEESQGVVKGFISGSLSPKILTRMNNLPCLLRCFNQSLWRREKAPRDGLVRGLG